MTDSRSALHYCAMSNDVPTSGTLSDQVAEEVRVLLARRRMSGRELARRLHVSANWVSLRTSGSQPIDLNDLSRIAEVLEVDPSDLLPKPVTRQFGKSLGIGERVVAVIGQDPHSGSAVRTRRNPRPTHRPGRAVSQTRPLSPVSL